MVRFSTDCIETKIINLSSSIFYHHENCSVVCCNILFVLLRCRNPFLKTVCSSLKYSRGSRKSLCRVINSIYTLFPSFPTPNQIFQHGGLDVYATTRDEDPEMLLMFVSSQRSDSNCVTEFDNPMRSHLDALSRSSSLSTEWSRKEPSSSW